MKLECVKEKLKEVVLLAEKLSGKNNNLPILQSILLIADGKSLKIRATNLDIGAEFEIPAKIEKKGSVSVPGNILSNTLNNLQKDKNITISLINNNLYISTENSSTTIKSFSSDEFPTLPIIKEGVPVVISAQQLTNGLKSVVFSASISDIKPEISSVYIYQDGDYLVFAATDSFRLAEKKILNKKTKEFQGVILPLKNTHEIIRILENTQEDVVIHTNKNQISFYYGGVYITSRVINAIFPDYKQIIPKGHTTEAIILKGDLMSTLKISTVFSDKFHKTNLVLRPADKLFEISSQNPDTGENTTRVDASLEGDILEISFNHKYILECLHFIKEDSVTLQFNGENKPLMIKGLGDTSFLYLVMPINK